MVALLIRQSYQCLVSFDTLRPPPCQHTASTLAPRIILLWLLSLLSMLNQARRSSAAHAKLE